MRTTEIHAYGPHEHSMCGLAPEAFESGDHEEPVVFAEAGELVTCQSCRLFIDHVRDWFKLYRYRPPAGAGREGTGS